MHGMGHTTERRTWGERSKATPWGQAPHLGLLPELLAVKPFHFHSCISFLIGGALQSQMAWRECREQVECSRSSHSKG